MQFSWEEKAEETVICCGSVLSGHLAIGPLLLEIQTRMMFLADASFLMNIE